MFDLSVLGKSYGSFMSRQNAKAIAEHTRKVLLDLQSYGMLPRSAQITFEFSQEKNDDGVYDNSTQAVLIRPGQS